MLALVRRRDKDRSDSTVTRPEVARQPREQRSLAPAAIVASLRSVVVGIVAVVSAPSAP